MMAVSDPWITLGMDYYQCLAAFDGLCKEVYICRYENELAGFVVLQVCGSFKGYIQTICVEGTIQGCGFGKKILAFCESRILELSFQNIYLRIRFQHGEPSNFYQSLGFKLVGELTGFY